MLTQNEISALSLSPTKKDFVQIWNELIDVAGKLSERWDPTSTNESDPGIVILKALAGIADKLNYNIDKNTLEAFMPTAAQEDSMRKLCEMLGYNVKYYRSAKTNITLKYHNTDPTAEEAAALNTGLTIPKFTVITNSDQDISYFTTNEVPLYLTSTTPIIEVPCMEGQLVKCESINDNNVISSSQISENNRYYLPETQIAENGIFIYNIFNGSGITGNDVLEDGVQWKKVENLNAQVPGSLVYKFGFDSYESRPYVEFPDDYTELFGDGIFIYYTRTSGAAGNVSSRTLTKLEFPSTTGWDKVAAESINVENVFAATSGANIETIKQAYNNFKKTIGTFETLVTCRDYMNKIYSMLNDLDKPIVSNILVTDIRNDLNRAVTICSCDRAGIFYKEMPRITKATSEETVEVTRTASTVNKPKLSDSVLSEEISIDVTDAAGESATYTATRRTNWFIGSVNNNHKILLHADKFGNNFLASAEGFIANTFDEINGVTPTLDQLGEVTEYTENGAESDYWLIKQGTTVFTTRLPITWITNTKKTDSETDTKDVEAMNHFDLVLYPFKSYTQIKSNVRDVRSVYDSSFTYSSKSFNEVKGRLESEDIKTIAHTMVAPRINDTISINNYLRLNATIATTSKITIEEGAIIIDKIKIALANAFNMRELDFGEEIPFDSIVEVMENADSRIRLVSLNEPALYTTFSVFTGYDLQGNPVIKEYAVASDWLTTEQAVDAKRFDMDKFKKVEKADKTIEKISLSTYNTKEARERYNELAVRNVLAGRVPLFDYNNTFKTSFSEGAYQVTRACEQPKDMVIPTQANPFTIYVINDKIYTGRYDEKADPKCQYTETFVPEEFKNNIITQVADEKITDITTECKIFATAGKISDVELNAGEFVKFRAPNFTTIKTYPAYVNYHLALNKETIAEAVNAEAYSLFSLMNKNRDNWTVEDRKNNWQAALDYFAELDTVEGRTGENKYKKLITQTQQISAYAGAGSTEEDTCTTSPTKKHEDNGTGYCKHCNTKMLNKVQKGPIIIDIKDETLANEDKDLVGLLNKSGCLRLSDNHDIKYDKTDKKFIIKPILTWVPDANGATPDTNVGPNLDIQIKLSSIFITSSNILTELNTTVQNRLEEMLGQVQADGSTPVLPTAGDWTISFEYEAVPFEAMSLEKWKNFILNPNNNIADFTPFTENDVVFWRVFGEGYSSGKYILQSSEKLLEFDRNYFGLLPEARLRGIYLIKNVGKDAQTAIIKNDEEYRLRANEYLYIEYTPSSTTEDGTTKEGDPITEILGEGTIIRPSGFETGLKDSSAEGHPSYHKTVTFITDSNTSKQVSLLRFGANEQVEIRDFAKVELNKNTFKSSPTIFYYKNFNGCEALEDKNYKGKRSYTLKDGEYFFYTDQNKTELAYFSTGTEIQLTGGLLLDQFDAIELSTIFDSGISEIPWGRLRLSSEKDSVILQEYQYITLGPEDTIKSMTLMGGDGISTAYLNDTWQYCNDVEYTLAGSEEVFNLSTINTYDDRVDLSKGCGWEVSSTLELDVAYNAEQILRNTDKVQTSITLSSSSSAGGGVNTPLTITPEDASRSLAFKTNLSCQTSSNHINIDDIYSNPKKLTGFELKIFSKEAPALVETIPGKVVPYDTTITDITNWPGTSVDIRSNNALWKEIDLASIKVPNLTVAEPKEYDNALRLPVSVLPKTYGVFSIYVDYTTTDVNAETWIEVLPGTSPDDITLFNMPLNTSSESFWREPAAGTINGSPKLMLRPGINCIRVNKTCRLFIKTSANSQGSIFFDDLKLVNSLPITYKLSDDREIPANTYGLNIKQLGYLNPDDVSTFQDTLAVLDEDVRKNLIKSSVDAAFEQLNKIEKANNKQYSTNYDTLTEVQPKLDKILGLVEAAQKDLNKLSTKAGDASSKQAVYNLFVKHKDLAAELEKEKTLLEALKANPNVELLDNDLAKLLSTFAASEETQQKLQQELLDLKESLFAELATISKEAYLADFEDSMSSRYTSILKQASGDSTPKPLAIAMENASKELIEQDYNAKIVPLLAKIDKVVNSEDRVKLLTILSDLRNNTETAARTQLLLSVKQAIEASDFTEIEGLLDSILNAAIQADYQLVSNSVVRLQAQLSETDFEALIAELETAAEESNDSRLSEIVTALRNIVDDTTATDYYGGTATTTGTTIPSTIPNLLATILYRAKDLHNKEDEDTYVTDCVKALHQKVSALHKSQFKELLTEIENALKDIIDANSTYATAIKELQDSTDAQVSVILSDLNSAAKTRQDYLDKLALAEATESNAFRDKLKTSITSFSSTMFSEELPFCAEAIYIAWKDFRHAEIVDEINTSVASVSDKLQNLTGSANISEVSVDSLLTNGKTVFDSFVTKVISLANQTIQNQSFSSLITGLPYVISSDLTAELSKFAAAQSINKAVVEKVDAYNKASGTLAKQKAAKALKQALTDNISILEQLVAALTDVLCPTLFTLTEKIPEAFDTDNTEADDFYAFWISALQRGYTEIDEAVGDPGNATKLFLRITYFNNQYKSYISETDANKALLTALKSNTLEEWLVSDVDLTTLNISAELLSTLLDMRLICKINHMIKEARAEDFSALSSTDISNWLTSRGFTEDDTSILDNDFVTVFTTLAEDVETLTLMKSVSGESKDAYNYLMIERQLLKDINKLDPNRYFYYTAPNDLSLAIEFNESDSELNTLMNPSTNYDVNNVNNSFVISKLDIDYLDKGIQIARSSRLN